MRRVLLVSYTFPPQYDISARRAAKLCKYLPAAWWEPVVLTKDWTTDVAPEDRAYALTSHPQALDELDGLTIVRVPYRTRDNALRRLHQRLGGAYVSNAPGTASAAAGTGVGSTPGWAPNGTDVAWTPRTVARRTLSLLSPTFGDFPDAFRGWVPRAVHAGVDAIRAHSIDAICSLCPPATAHVVASEIARRTGVPWVAQFDDLYSFHLERQRRPEWRPYADHRHRRWMRQASAVGAITPAMLQYVERTYGVSGDVVMVGFDPAEQPSGGRPRGDRLRIAYTGSVYLGDQRPEIFFEALERLIGGSVSTPAPVEVVFAGTGCDEELKARLTAYPAASSVCEFVGRVPPLDALRLQREADALLLFNCTTPTADEGTLSFPAKTFEYLNAGRPILAVPRDPGGWGDRLLETTGAGIAADSAESAAAILARWVKERNAVGSLAYHGKPEEVAQYSQPRQAAALAGLLDRAVEAGSR